MGGNRQTLSENNFDVPRQPIEFVKFLSDEYKDKFEQISTARLDPRFAGVTSSTKDNEESTCTNNIQASLLSEKDNENYIDIAPKAGTLVLFDSVSLPHLVREVTASRQRIAATGVSQKTIEHYYIELDNTFFLTMLFSYPLLSGFMKIMCFSLMKNSVKVSSH